MNKKNIISFLLLKPAFSSRNLTSLILVAVFFGVYVLSGGTITAPTIKSGGAFGSVDNSRVRTAPVSGDVIPDLPGEKKVGNQDGLFASPAGNSKKGLFDSLKTSIDDDAHSQLKSPVVDRSEEESSDKPSGPVSRDTKDLSSILDRISKVKTSRAGDE